MQYIIVSVFVPGWSHAQKVKKWVCTARAVLVQKLNNNSQSKCKSKSPKKTRLQKSAVLVEQNRFCAFETNVLTLLN
jgi:hypothetical protein